jgi:hypothetical protein
VAGVVCSYFASWPLALYFRRKIGIGGWRADAALVPAFVVGLLVGQTLTMLLGHVPRLQH